MMQDPQLTHLFRCICGEEVTHNQDVEVLSKIKMVSCNSVGSKYQVSLSVMTEVTR